MLMRNKTARGCWAALLGLTLPAFALSAADTNAPLTTAPVLQTNAPPSQTNAPAPQATGFQIWRSVNGGAFAVLPAASALPLSPTTFQDLTVTAGTTYAYRVYASIGPALSSPSNTATLVSLAPPSNLRQAAIAAGNVTLSWTAPTSTAGETGYALSRCTGSNATCSAVGATWTTIATMGLTTTTFRNTGLVAPNQYTYRVQATGPGGTSSPFSNYLTVTAQ